MSVLYLADQDEVVWEALLRLEHEGADDQAQPRKRHLHEALVVVVGHVEHEAAWLSQRAVHAVVQPSDRRPDRLHLVPLGIRHGLVVRLEHGQDLGDGHHAARTDRLVLLLLEGGEGRERVRAQRFRGCFGAAG